MKNFLIDNFTDLNKSIRENRQSIEKYFALTTLHFKPHDEIFANIEHKYHQVEGLLEKLAGAQGKEKEAERRELREKVSTAVIELTLVSRHILKTEWEHVKAGEPAYKRTKAWSLYVGIGAFVILIVCGIYMLAYAQIKS